MKPYMKKFLGDGAIRNHSSKSLWVIETTTNHPKGPALAHILNPGMKSPLKIDADGLKSSDDIIINGHKNWWKIGNWSIADVFDAGKGFFVAVSYKRAVNEDHFGPVEYIKNENWGIPINYILDVKCNKKKNY